MQMSVADNWSEGCNSSEDQNSYSEHLFALAFFGIVFSSTISKFLSKAGGEGNTVVTAMSLESSQAGAWTSQVWKTKLVSLCV